MERVDALVLQSNGVLKIKFGSRRDAQRRVFDLEISWIHLTEKILKFRLLTDNASSMYLYVKLNWNVNCFLPDESKLCRNYASYEYRKF